MAIINPKSLVLRAKNGYVGQKLKKMAYVSLSGEMKCVNVAIINPFKVAGFESKEWLCSSEIKEDGLLFVERQCGRSSTPPKPLVLRAKNGNVARKLKKMAYVSFSGEMRAIYDVN